jgi:hypothetical protein
MPSLQRDIQQSLVCTPLFRCLFFRLRAVFELRATKGSLSIGFGSDYNARNLRCEMRSGQTYPDDSLVANIAKTLAPYNETHTRIAS